VEEEDGHGRLPVAHFFWTARPGRYLAGLSIKSFGRLSTIAQ
jgi:hypothetical protein